MDAAASGTRCQGGAGKSPRVLGGVLMNSAGGRLARKSRPRREVALKNNYLATSDPSARNDSSQGYDVGSTWINVASGTMWECSSTALGAAVWTSVASASILTLARGNLASRAPAIYDNFDAPDGTRVQGRISPTGQTWFCTGPGVSTLEIIGGRMTAQDNCYNYLPVQTGRFYRQSEVVSFLPVPGGSGDRAVANAVMLATSGTQLQGKFFHVQVTPDSYTLQQTATGTSGLDNGTYGGGSWGVPWPTDGTPLNCSVEYDFVGRTATIFGPDGQSRIHAFAAAVSGDVGIQQSDINYVGWQLGLASFFAYYWIVESGPSLAGALASSGNAAPMGVVSPIYGFGFRRLKPFKLSLAGGGGAWFRVVTGEKYGNLTASGWAIAGTIRFDATDGGAYTNAWKFDCTSVESGVLPAQPDPILTHKQGVAMNVFNLITQARLSLSPSFSSPNVALDLFVNNSSPVPNDPATITGVFEGYGEIVAAPVRGISPLDGTKVVTLNFVNGN